MGSVLGTAAEKVGGFLWNTISSPFKSFLGKTCEDKCGDWDGLCYIENGCVASLFRLFIACTLTVITASFLYVILWKTGLVRCITKKSCKLSWKACWGCFHALGSACSFLWHKLRNTKRVYRGRRACREVEMTGISWSETDWSGSTSVRSRKRVRSPVCVRERKKDRTPASKQIAKVERHPEKRSRTEQRARTTPPPCRATGMTRHDRGCVQH